VTSTIQTAISMQNDKRVSLATICFVLGATFANAAPLEVKVPMADGVRLSTIVLLPDGAGPFPAIVVRSPYGLPTSPPGAVQLKEDATAEEILATWAPALKRGYAIVQQNTRGRGNSEGIDMLFQADRADGRAFARWIISQEWSDGTFRVTGDSADGFSGYLMAAERPAGLTGAFFQASCANLLKQGVIRDTGGLQMEVLAPWIIQQAWDSGAQNLKDMAARGVDKAGVRVKSKALLDRMFGGDGTALMQRPLAAFDPVASIQPNWAAFIGEAGYGERSRYFDAAADIEVPVTHVGLWQDTFLDCTVDAFNRAKGDQSLIVLNGSHYDIDNPETWAAAGLETAFLDWLDKRSKPAVRYMVENGPADRLFESGTWPPKAPRPWTLFLNKDALSPQERTSGRIGTIVTDIEEAVPTEAGRNLVVPSGSEMSGLPVDGNGRVVRLGPQLSSNAVLLGKVTLHLSIRTDAEDADVVARLIALDVVGKPRQLLETLFRARYRAGRAAPTPLKANEAVPISIPLGSTAHYLKAGERLGLVLQGSNVPRWDMASGFDIDPSLAGSAKRIVTQVESDGTARLELPMLGPAELSDRG
jgi:putative CocE/NonD family hydrolase